MNQSIYIEVIMTLSLEPINLLNQSIYSLNLFIYMYYAIIGCIRGIGSILVHFLFRVSINLLVTKIKLTNIDSSDTTNTTYVPLFLIVH